MFRCQGLIDFAALTPSADTVLPIHRSAQGSACDLPGLHLQWRGDDASVACNGRAIVLALGRSDDKTGAAIDASGWLERYLRRGDGAAAEIGGRFAVVVIELDRRRALLFVDRFATETLCYRATNGTLGFSDRASDVPGSRQSLDAQALFDYLYFHMIPSPRTVFEDVHRVEPAQCVTAGASGAKGAVYWKPAFVEDDDRDQSRRLRKFLEIVRESVEREARVPQTACFLSGGTDSSTVAGMLTRIRGVPAHGYSIGFDAAGYDEMAYARIAARHFGLVHHEYYVTPDDVAEAMPRLAASFDQPFGNSSVLPAYYCARRAREDGFTHMLAGDGGDELFAGNSRYAWQQVFDVYHRLPRALRHRVVDPAASSWPLFRRVPGFRQLGGYVRHARHDMPDRLETFQLLDRLDQDEMFDQAFQARIDGRQPLLQQRRHWHACEAASLVNRMLAYDWKYTLADNDLPKVRMATQLAGTTVGFPLLSEALTDFSLALPPRWKLRRLKLRWFYKEALRDFLPTEILRKKKHGFGLPFGPWAVAHASLRTLVEDSLNGVATRGIVRPAFLDRLLHVHLPDTPGYYGEMVWILVMLEQWLRAHEAPLTKTSPIPASIC